MATKSKSVDDSIPYRWMCSRCGKQGLAANRSSARKALVTHIVSASEGGHGAIHSYPEDYCDDLDGELHPLS